MTLAESGLWLGILLCGILLYHLPWYAELRFACRNGEWAVTWSLRLTRKLRLYSRAIPVFPYAKQKKAVAAQASSLPAASPHLAHSWLVYGRYGRYCLKWLVCEKLEWTSRVGCSDAAVTALLVACFWAVKGASVAWLQHYCPLRQTPMLSVTPSYQEALCETDFLCILRLKTGHLIRVAIFVWLEKIKEAAVRVRTSDSRVDEKYVGKY